MQTYQINDLERLTGIKAHTIRIWEKRYHIITPSRTDTNRRYYSDEQVRKLLNITTLLSKGHKISKVAAYTQTEVDNLIQSTVAEEQGAYAGYINDLLKYMLSFDQHGFERVFTKAVGHFGVQRAMIYIVYPFLNKTGILWSVNKAAPVQEHFATCIIRRKLIAMTDNIPLPTPGKMKFLLFLPPAEWHEIGLLFANYIIRSKGHDTIYLGQNVPIDDAVKTAGAMTPSYIMLFYTTARPKEEIQLHIDELRRASKNKQILIAGNTELFPAKKSSVKDVTYLQGVDDLIHFL